ncbi:MAG: alpha/beta hydrolase [Aureispira sp.]|nr:alpha/beta hydrolase [Aureispira sp.]
MREVYYISGLGADKSIFQRLDIEVNSQKFIEWIVPERCDSIEDYAKKLIQQIDTTKDIILIGVSFGGIIATEIAKLINVEDVILISSAKHFSEIPLVYRIAGKLRLHKILPTKVLKWANPFTYFFFGMQSKDEKLLLKTILKNTESSFLKWAIDKIVNWKNITYRTNFVQLHGTKDRILPLPKKKNIIKIEHGGHLMVYQKSIEISEIINQTLKKT